MTPNEKAINIYNSMRANTTKRNNAKRCALIAVDEILEALPPFEYGLEFVAKIEFWNNVKQEIKKL